MDEQIEIIRCKIPLERYERQITDLIETLLRVDEKVFSNENLEVNLVKEGLWKELEFI